jgi:DNA-binding GntR family transcriptional regulator
MSGTTITLKEKAFIHLRKLILNGELKPGEVLTERMLVEMMEMSRTPIRAALERLDAEGLANYTPNKGLVVAELSLRKAIDLYDYRIAMECFVVRKLASMELEKSDLKWFEQNLRQQQTHVEKSDYALFTETDTQYHRKLVEIYANSEITQAMERLQDQLYRIAMGVLRKDRTRISVSYDDHLRIFQFIQAGEADKASQAMEEHLEFGKRILIM